MAVVTEGTKEKLGVPVPTFEAYDRATGEKIVVDHRTFDKELHSEKPVKAKADPGGKS